MSPQGKLVLCHRLTTDGSESANRAWWRDVLGPAVHDRRDALGFVRYEQLHCEGPLHPVRAAIELSRSQVVSSLVALATPDPDDAPGDDGDGALVDAERWDVLDEFWWSTPEEMLQALTSSAGREALADLHELFAPRSDVRAGVVGAEHVIAAPALEQREAARVAICIRGRPEDTPEQMQDYWLNNHGGLVKELAPRLEFDQYDQAHAITNDERADAILSALGASQDRPYVGVASLSFTSLSDLTISFATPSTLAANLELMKDELAFIDPPASPPVVGVRTPVRHRASGELASDRELVPSHPTLFGQRRSLTCPTPVRHRFTAGDGSVLQVHHIAGGVKGPIVMAPGTAMTALSFLTDTTDESFAEYLAGEGYDVWLFDWRTSPELDAHTTPYSFDDVARYDWPAAIEYVRNQTGADAVAVLAHCLSSPCLFLSLLRGYMDPSHIAAFIPSQVALHPVANLVHRIKVAFRADVFLSGDRMVHQSTGGPRRGIWDFSVGVLAKLIPKSYRCSNPACHRQSATYGDIIGHDRISDETHALMSDLVPQVHTSFLQSAGPLLRAKTIMTGHDQRRIDRLSMPMLLISGEKNQMFVPDSTERSYRLLHRHHGDKVERLVFTDFGHLDCWFGQGARNEIWPQLTEFLDRSLEANGRAASS